MTEIFNFYTKFFVYLDEKILWTNRVLFVIVILYLCQFYLKIKNFQFFIVSTMLILTFFVNIARFSPVIEDFTIDYNISTTSLLGINYFSHNDYEGLKYIINPISYEETNVEGIKYLYLNENTIRNYSDNKENWNYPNSKFINSLSSMLKKFNNFKCDIEKKNMRDFNVKITDNSGTYKYCFDQNE